MVDKYIILAILFVTLLYVNLSEYLEGFNYRIPINITENSGNDLYDYQVLITINTQELISQGKMRNDCGDIRFTDSDGVTLLNYWIEPNNCNTENTRIWVKVPYIPANSNKTIYLYYGNPEATSLSNGTATFIAFDWKFDGPISSRYAHTCALLSNGSIMCWGYNNYGQLGLGYTSYSEPTPQQVIGIDNAIAISSGGFHTCALLSNGSIMCWGANWAGQLGLGYTSYSEPTPRQLIGIDNAIAISSGGAHTCALLSNGTIMCWGTNWAGQLGLGYTSTSEPTPRQLIGIDNAIAISSGGAHTCALLSNGYIICWGYNYYGQLGLGYTSEYEPTPKQVIGIDNAIAISTGDSHTCALLSNGSIMCWGYNYYGQLGLGYTSTSEPTPKQTLNYNLGGMYFKTNDIYTPHTSNDIYFVRVYVEIEPTITLGNEESIAIAYLIEVEFSENWKNIVIEDKLIPNKETHIVIYPSNVFIRITNNTNVGTSIAFYLPNNGYIESLNVTFFDEYNNLYIAHVEKGGYSNIIHNNNVFVTTPYEEKILNVLFIDMSIIPPFNPGEYTSVIKICVYRHDLDPISACGF
ncbi:MAG: DUF2341 domain-containing protein [Candidatus Aenigmatarchaeota archaeon]